MQWNRGKRKTSMRKDISLFLRTVLFVQCVSCRTMCLYHLANQYGCIMARDGVWDAFHSVREKERNRDVVKQLRGVWRKACGDTEQHIPILELVLMTQLVLLQIVLSDDALISISSGFVVWVFLFPPPPLPPLGARMLRFIALPS